MTGLLYTLWKTWRKGECVCSTSCFNCASLSYTPVRPLLSILHPSKVFLWIVIGFLLSQKGLLILEKMINLFKVKAKQKEIAENANGKMPGKKQSAGELRLHKGFYPSFQIPKFIDLCLACSLSEFSYQLKFGSCMALSGGKLQGPKACFSQSFMSLRRVVSLLVFLCLCKIKLDLGTE